jgi:hypothetical protein
MRLPSIPILLALATVFPAHCAWGQTRIRSDAKLTEETAAVWSSIKSALQANDGDVFFESNLKSSLFPGGRNGVRVFRGTVVSSRPAEQPSELVIAISDNNQPEVTLKLKEGHFKGPITPGSKVAFRGIVTGYTKDPFMLTLEVGGEDGSGLTFALVLVEEARDEAAAMQLPSLWVNYPSKVNTGSVKISLEGFGLHSFTVDHHGATTEMEGVRLERFLVSAGWYAYPHSLDKSLHYAVEVEGAQSAVTLDLEGGLGSFERQSWLVPTGKPGSPAEAALVVVRADGTLIQRVEGIQRIRVSER